MRKSKRVQACVAYLSLSALANCSAQPTPTAEAPAPATNAPSAPAPSASASASAAPAPVPVLTPTGVVSSGPLPPPAPSASATGATPPAAPNGKMCGGIAGFRCPEKQFCSYAPSAKCGAGDMAGTCQPIPEMCTMIFAPVCGCDGKTYSSACIAGRAGVSVAQNGACAGDSGSGIAEGKLCGTRGVNGECAEGLYCAYRSQCGDTDAGGTCAKKPQACTREYAPVCGCDNHTYSNKCEAAHAGASVASSGECKAK